MDTIQAIYERRSIKLFDQGHVMPDETFEKLIMAARQAPSSYNLQHTRLVHITNDEIKKEISKAAYDQPQVLSSSVLFLIVGDTRAWEKNPARCWKNAPEQVQKFILDSIPTFHKAQPWIARDEAIRSGALTAMTLMLAAKSLGDDSCPMIGFNQEEVKKIVSLPMDFVPVMLLPIGKGIKPPNPKPGFIPMEEFLIKDRFT